MKVIVCDDAQFMRRIIVGKISKIGYEVIGEAESGEEAIEKCRLLKPDIVTMDVTLKDMSGVEAVGKIKKENPNVSIVMCSAMGQRWIILDALKAGAEDFVVKPFEDGRLEEAVRGLRRKSNK